MDEITAAEMLLSEQDKTIGALEQNICEINNQIQQLKIRQQELRHIIICLKNNRQAPAGLPDKDEQNTQTEPTMARELSKEQKKVIQLRNGQVNIAFKEEIDPEEFGISKDADIRFEGIEQLKWQKENRTFEGIPSEAGEFIGIFKYRQTCAEGQNREREKEVHFLVNPDPRTLWQSIDPPEQAPYFKTNTDFAIETTVDKTVAALSVRGKSHAHKGSFREDHMLIRCHEKGWIIQIVADGAGSAKYSRQGSKIACEASCAGLTEYINSEKTEMLEQVLEQYRTKPHDSTPAEVQHYLNELCIEAARRAHREIIQFANDEGQSPKAFASTLLFTLTKSFDFGTIVIAFSIGDGAIAVADDRGVQIMMTPDGGEYSGQTRFVTMPELFAPEHDEALKQRVNMKLSEHHKATILMTDGVSDPKFGTDNKLKDTALWQTIWTELQTVMNNKEELQAGLSNWLDFYIPGEYDDRTISVLA